MTIRIRNAEQFKRACAENGHNIQSLADSIGLHRDTIGRIVRGVQNISPKKAAAIANTLNKPFNDLFQIIEKEA